MGERVTEVTPKVVWEAALHALAASDGKCATTPEQLHRHILFELLHVTHNLYLYTAGFVPTLIIAALHLIEVGKVVHTAAITGPAPTEAIIWLYLFRLHLNLVTHGVLGVDLAVGVTVECHTYTEQVPCQSLSITNERQINLSIINRRK